MERSINADPRHYFYELIRILKSDMKQMTRFAPRSLNMWASSDAYVKYDSQQLFSTVSACKNFKEPCEHVGEEKGICPGANFLYFPLNLKLVGNWACKKTSSVVYLRVTIYIMMHSLIISLR